MNQPQQNKGIAKNSLHMNTFTDLEIQEIKRKLSCADRCTTCHLCPSHGIYKRLKLNDGNEVMVYKPNKDTCSPATGPSPTD